METTRMAGQAMASMLQSLPSLKNAIGELSEQSRSEEPSSKNPSPQPSHLGSGPDTFRQALFRLDESHHPKVKEMAEFGEWFVRELRSPSIRPVMLSISGSPGCGKTHTARRINEFSKSYGADILMQKPIAHWSSIWIDWPTVAESDDENDFRDVLFQLTDPTLVIIDDIGSESDRFKNGVSNSRLRRVLSSTEKKWVVITCNGSRKEIMEIYDMRVVDRLRRFEWVDMGEVPSYRPKLK